MFSRDEFNSYVKGNLNNRIHIAKKNLVKRIASDTDRLVPYKTGRLASEIDYLEDATGIRYTAEYAPYVLGLPASTNFSREKHPEATANWTGVSYQSNVEDWYSYFKSEVE